MRPKCTATTKAGKPCQAFAMPDTDLCFVHDPNNAKAMREIRRAGGIASGNENRMAKRYAEMARGVAATDMPGILIGAGIACLGGELEPNQLTAFAGAAKAAINIAEAAQIEVRIQELEKLLGVTQENGQ